MSHVPASTITDDSPLPAARPARASVTHGRHPAAADPAAVRGVTA
ncbi:hypothetical protein [Streptomyces sp. NPDC056160]